MTHISSAVLSPAAVKFVRFVRKCKCATGVFGPSCTDTMASTDSVLPFHCRIKLKRGNGKERENKQLKIMNYRPKHQLTPPTETREKNVRR